MQDFLSIYARECGKASEALTNVVQFRANRNQLTFARLMALKCFCWVAELDGSRRLAARVGVQD